MATKKHNYNQGVFEELGTVAAMPEAYYSGDRPNQHLRQFIEQKSKPYDLGTDDYEADAYDQPLTATKATAIYNMHTYASKKPHDAIRKYVCHYTQPGDVVLDPFCGSGGTALAALLEERCAIAIDRSPAATFLTKNYCTPVSSSKLMAEYNKLVSSLKAEMEWLYETKCDRCGGKALTGYTVYSHVYQCKRCLQFTPLFDCHEVTVALPESGSRTALVCPFCYPKHAEEIDTSIENKQDSIPVLVVYHCESGCKPKRGERRHNDADPKKRKYFYDYDLGKLREIESKPIPYWFPKQFLMNREDSSSERWGLLWRPYHKGIRRVSDLYTKRNLWASAALRHGIREVKDSDIRDALLFGFTSVILNATKMYRELKRSIASGLYYIPSLSRDLVLMNGYDYKVRTQLVPGYQELSVLTKPSIVISTQSATSLLHIPTNSIDYIFTDPPYSWKVQYGEINFVWEAWIGADTNWHNEEIIVNEVREKTEAEWAELMRKAMSECYRVLKPGRWLSLCYHDSSEGTWELVQDIMAEVGFVVGGAESPVSIDMQQKSWKQTVSDKITKRDLVLNFRKPKPGEWRLEHIFIPANADIATFQELARHVIRDFLTTHPGATKDRIYDALISCMVRKGQMEAHDFVSLLNSVADEVQEPVKEDLFHNKEPDLWGSHVQSRWYLKETADQVDYAEQAKEDAAAACLSKFVGKHLEKRPEFEGVHYSDLFEQYLPVRDKPRRLLADWLPEYFIKTASGTWRLPDKPESEQLAELRAAGTLRRIKRFANTLIEGVPVRDKDRPGSDIDVLDWLRQCRRAGLYEQGKAIYEKGGLNLANLTDEQQIEAEDDYRICARRGGDEGAKPKRKTRQKQDDDE